MSELFESYLTTMRSSSTNRVEFRYAADHLTHLLAQQVANLLPTEPCTVETPIQSTIGRRLAHPVALVVILRSGLAMLPAFQSYYREAPVGFVGFERDETTAIAQLYYLNIPSLTPEHRIIVLDPMLATGGTMCKCLRVLIDKGIAEERLLYVSIIAAPEGCEQVAKHYSKAIAVIGKVDHGLNAQKFIVPGLGDFGDRYFGRRA